MDILNIGSWLLRLLLNFNERNSVEMTNFLVNGPLCDLPRGVAVAIERSALCTVVRRCPKHIAIVVLRVSDAPAP